MSNAGYAIGRTTRRPVPQIRASTQIKRARYTVEDKPMKLTFKQRIRNWLMNDSDNDDHYNQDITIDENDIDLQSNSFRLKVYSASGGTIIETTKYDRTKDENRHSLHVVTDDKDLGESISKIITMESLR